MNHKNYKFKTKSILTHSNECRTDKVSITMITSFSFLIKAKAIIRIFWLFSLKKTWFRNPFIYSALFVALKIQNLAKLSIKWHQSIWDLTNFKYIIYHDKSLRMITSLRYCTNQSNPISTIYQNYTLYVQRPPITTLRSDMH